MNKPKTGAEIEEMYKGVLEFDWCYGDIVLEHVIIDLNNNTYTINRVDDEIVFTIEKFLPYTVDEDVRNAFYMFMERRLFCKLRADCAELCERRGFDNFDVLGLFFQSRGATPTDRMWARFKNEALTYDQVMNMPSDYRFQEVDKRYLC